MVFANLFFLYIFLPVNLILYYATRSYAVRNFVLVAMSFLFYAWGEPVWVLLLLASGFMVWFCSLLVERFAGTRRGKAALIFAVTISLSLLGIFKYSGFLIENINAVLPLSLPVPQFSLPIGISFYTFQMISYIVDVYRGDVKAQPSFLRFIMYVSMYFQLVAGPIVRYSDVAWEIDHRTRQCQRHQPWHYPVLHRPAQEGCGGKCCRFAVGAVYGRRSYQSDCAGKLVRRGAVHAADLL